MTELGFQGSTKEWRWPVVDITEPPDIRVIRGYVTILERHTPGEGSYHTIHFADVDRQPIGGFTPDEYWMFMDAVAAALRELGLLPQIIERDIVGDIVR